MKAITTKYTPSGYSACDGDGNRARIGYPAAINGIEARHFAAAQALCKKMGWTGRLVGGQQKPGVYVWCWVNEPSSLEFDIATGAAA